MRLISARVRLFRNIVDSGLVEIDQSITALVGKNEAGKSAFLTALYRLNSAHNTKFNLLEDAPRWRLRADQRKGSFSETAPIEARFELEDADRDALIEHFGFEVALTSPLRVSRYYDNSRRSLIALDEKKTIRNMMATAKATKRHLHRPSRLDTLMELLNTSGDSDSNEDVGERPDPLADLSFLADRLFAEDSPPETVGKLLLSRLPRFFLFDEWSELPGRIELAVLLGNDPKDLDPGMRTALSLVTMSGGTVEEFLDEDYETRKAELEASANEITQKVFEYWTQNDTLSVSFDSEEGTQNIPDGYKAVVKWLQVRIQDKRHGMTTRFDLRSTGFQWFFSFLAVFSEYEHEKDIVVLLDEPGLGLHGRAQRDFMRFIDERLASNHQVVYTTHSPFMIEPEHLERIRIVEDDPDLAKAATVTSDIRVRDPDTLFPLQGALGYDIAQALFVAEQNLVVEGVSDLIYLNTLSHHLSRIKRGGLDEHWSIVPIAGAAKIPTFVALLGASLNVTVLIDSTRATNDRLAGLRASGLLEGSRILLLGPLTNRPGNIEDLFTDGEYIRLYNDAFGTAHRALDISSGSDSILERIRRLRGHEYDHAEPAIAMLADRDKFLAKLSDKTLDRYQTLFDAINATA